MTRPATTPATREDGASGADGEREADWKVSFSSDGGSALIYSLRQDGWRHGQPLMVNDIEVRVSASAKSESDINPVVQAILSALRPLSPDQPSARERRLEEALRFYAAEDLPPNEGPWGVNSTDFGTIARQALAHNQEGGR